MERTIQNQSRDTRYKLYDFTVIYSMLVFLGFPGNFTMIFGNSIYLFFQYSAWFLQIIVMLFSSGNDFMDMKIVDLKTRYAAVYGLMTVFGILSIAVTSYPKEQFIAIVHFSTTIFFGLWIVEKYDVEHVLELIYKAQVVFLIGTLIFFILRPGECFNRQNGELSFIGLFSVKNACALEFCYAILAQVLLLIKKRESRRHISLIFIAVLLIQIPLILICKATGAILCLIISIAYVLYWYIIRQKKERLNIGLWFVVISVGFLFFSLSILAIMTPFLESIGKDATLTGRTLLWKQFIATMQSTHTMTGFGYSMFWKDDVAVKLLHSKFTQGSGFNQLVAGSHNMVLELWGDVGLIGLTAFFLMTLLAFRDTKHMDNDTYLFCSANLLMIMVKGLTERVFAVANYQTVMMFIVVGFGFLSQAKKKMPYTSKSPPIPVKTANA